MDVKLKTKKIIARFLRPELELPKAVLGGKKKYKAHISKYVPCILKYVRPIFRDVFEACPNMSA